MTDKLIFLVCEDDGQQQSKYMRYITSTMVSSKGILFTVKQVSDGMSGLKFLQNKGNASGVILITDGDLPQLSGWDLLEKTFKQNLLPAQTAMISSIDEDGFKRKINSSGLDACDPQLRFASKAWSDYRPALFIGHLATAAIRETGIQPVPPSTRLTISPAHVQRPARATP